LILQGGSAIGGVFGNTDSEESERVVHQALNSGINFIDTAPWYGQGKSEAVLGQVYK
jgi:L-galactose dehydrogenase